MAYYANRPLIPMRYLFRERSILLVAWVRVWQPPIILPEGEADGKTCFGGGRSGILPLRNSAGSCVYELELQRAAGLAVDVVQFCGRLAFLEGFVEDQEYVQRVGHCPVQGVGLDLRSPCDGLHGMGG